MMIIQPPLAIIESPLMPELPEVEVFKQFIDRHALHKTIVGVQVFQPKILASISAEEFIQTIIGRQFSGALRRGKHLFVQLQQIASSPDASSPLPWLFLHFGMSGYLSYQYPDQDSLNAYNEPGLKHNHIRIRFDFSDGSYLAFHEQRMFGKAGLIADPQAYITLKKIGPDALSMDRKTFLSRLKAAKGTIKPALMNQSLVAGVGNVYADEILFQCKIHPQARISGLTEHQFDRLFHQMQSVLQNTIAVGADRAQLPQNYSLHFRNPKGKCPQDQTFFEIRQVGGRTTYFCPNCQPLLDD
jgi:formamidopyrimidine-DNA glycosylase